MQALGEAPLVSAGLRLGPPGPWEIRGFCRSKVFPSHGVCRPLGFPPLCAWGLVTCQFPQGFVRSESQLVSVLLASGFPLPLAGLP